MWLLGAMLLITGCGRIGFGEQPEEGLVLHFTLDSIDATGTRDVYGMRATCDGPCPTLAPGHRGNALSFTADQRLSVPSSPRLEARNGFTVGAWFTWSGPIVDGYMCPVTKAVGPDVQNSWTICMQTDTHVFFATSQQNTVVMLASIQTIPPAQWHHVAVRWDGMTKTIWIDGALDVTMDGPTEFDTMPLSIGADYDSGAAIENLNGLVDEVRVYDRALADDEMPTLAL